MVTAIYILADERSGSTLLDQLLGGHPDIFSLGELHHLAAYVLESRDLYDPVHPLRCSCGERVSDCEFWQGVFARLDRPPEQLRLRLRGARPAVGRDEGRSTAQRLMNGFLSRRPASISQGWFALLSGARQVGADTRSVYEAAGRQADTRFVVDSSKDPFRFRAVYDYAPNNTRAIILTRDYRGTVHSKRKRGRDYLASTRTWVEKLRQIEAVTDDIAADRHIHLRYEDLCEDPVAEISRLCEFLELSFVESMLVRPSEGAHHIGGSPSKFDPGQRRIALDTGYLDAFSEDELTRMRAIVGQVARKWGYEEEIL